MGDIWSPPAEHWSAIQPLPTAPCFALSIHFSKNIFSVRESNILLSEDAGIIKAREKVKCPRPVIRCGGLAARFQFCPHIHMSLCFSCIFLIFKTGITWYI